MRKLNLLVLALAMVALSGCSVITGIFKTGFAAGIIVVVIVILIIVWAASKFRSK